jgi:hypothetical protein
MKKRNEKMVSRFWILLLIGIVCFSQQSFLVAKKEPKASKRAVKTAVPDDMLMVIEAGGHGSSATGGQAPYNKIPLEAQVAIMKEIGLHGQRAWGEFDTVGAASRFAKTWDYFYENGIDNLPCLNPGKQVRKAANAEEAYKYGYALGFDAAKVGKDHHVKYWDCGNEFGGIARNKWPDKYDSLKLAKCIGMQKGLIAGIHSADPNAKCMISDFRNIAYHQAAWNAGLRWDITGIHEYTAYMKEGFNDNTIKDPLNNKFPNNSLQYCKEHFNGLPIWITEWNENGAQGISPESHAKFFITELNRYKSVAAEYNLQRLFIYEFYKQPGLVVYEAEAGVVYPDGTLSPAADSIKSWIRRNPPFKAKK